MSGGFGFSLRLTPPAAPLRVPLQKAQVVRSYPHDPGAFTQGLVYREGLLFESAGLEARSTIREVRLEDGEVLRSVALPPTVFGEGIVDWRDEIISLTWRSGIGYRWDRAGLRRLGEFPHHGEGWGLTRNREEIIASDGTPALRFLDPATLAVRRRLNVTEGGHTLGRLNDLQWVKGEIFANVFPTDTIARIDPATGMVIARIDLSGVAAALGNRNLGQVANGIAYDADGDRLFVTGKYWPLLFEIRLPQPQPAEAQP